MQHTLEGQRLFSVVAWILIIIGAGFVLMLSLALHQASEKLVSYSDNNVRAVDTIGR